MRVSNFCSLQLAQLLFCDGVLPFGRPHSHGTIFGVLACSTESFLDKVMGRDVCVAATATLMASSCDVVYGFLSRIFEQVEVEVTGDNTILPEVLIHDVSEEPTACGKVKQILKIHELQDSL